MSSIETRVSKLEYRNVEYRKVEIRKSRINKVSDATYISDVVFDILRISRIFMLLLWRENWCEVNGHISTNELSELERL